VSFLDDIQDAQQQIGGYAAQAQDIVNGVKAIAGSYPQLTTPQGTNVGVAGAPPPGGWGGSAVQVGTPTKNFLQGLAEGLILYWKPIVGGLLLLAGGVWIFKKLK
jgi:hypothetical protein